MPHSRIIFHILQEAIAYFPLILLFSGLFGTAIAKVLNRRLGSKVSGR